MNVIRAFWPEIAYYTVLFALLVVMRIAGT